MGSEKDKVALTPAEFAALFGKSQTWGYRQLYSVKVKAINGYGRLLIPASEVERVLSEAGIYNGLNREVDVSPPESRAREPKRKSGSSSPWKKAIQSRKATPGTSRRSESNARTKQRMSSDRASALRKLNRK